jgi:hypothetical protein
MERHPPSKRTFEGSIPSQPTMELFAITSGFYEVMIVVAVIVGLCFPNKKKTFIRRDDYNPHYYD